VPSAGEAWNSLQVLNHDIALGWFIRGLHGWGSNFMVAIVLIHMVQVFLFGAYKYPRELTWMLGVMLLLVTLGMAFTGQALRVESPSPGPRWSICYWEARSSPAQPYRGFLRCTCSSFPGCSSGSCVCTCCWC